MRRIYLDHAATTPLDPRVLDAMMPYLTEHFGNASSLHALGRKARFAVEESREQIAALLGAAPAEVVFTSGGTESDNAAIKGVLRGGGRLITSAAEHEAVLRTAEARQAAGHPTTILMPGADGAVSPEAVEAAAQAGDLQAGDLVALMHANNEVGTMTDLAGVAAVCRAKGALLHTDAVQTAGLLRLDVGALDVDLLALSAHKFYGPKGVGVLFIRGGVAFEPFVAGGSQERRRRAGTEQVAAIVGMAVALRLAVEEADARVARTLRLRDRLYQNIDRAIGGAFVRNTPLPDGLAAPHILSIAFPPFEGHAVDGEMLLLNLDMAGICVSSGSACTSGALTPSHVLLAMGRDRATASAVVRFSLGKDNTEADVDEAAEQLATIVRRMHLVAR